MRTTPFQEGRHDVAGLLGEVGLTGMEERDTGGLSGGELQRLAVAAALARQPALLIADEIQSGFCRTGDWFASEYEQVVPDLITTAKGIAVTASSGDSGYGVSAPASFPSVIGVGGTSLTVDKLGRWASESAWAKGGSGCSKLNVAAPWQKPALTGCSGKSVVDVAAVADPATGVTVYFDGQWYTFGGTSASSPLVAALFALKSDFGDSAGAYLWGNSASLHDITDGATGRCVTKIWCYAGTGFDGPTGWGTPNGTGAF